MIKLFSLKQQKKDGEGGQQKPTRSAAQLRITKGRKLESKILFIRNFSLLFFPQISRLDINELNLPRTCTTNFPDPNDLLNFKMIICPDEGYYKGGRFSFNFKVSNLDHLQNIQNNLCCFLGRAKLSPRATEGEMRDKGLPSQHRPGGKCLLEHPARGLETRSHHQLDRVWASISFPCKLNR